ncbi:hypothetical protein ASE63_09220 [Bosea sp. Root381]|nr:hypothetical protein ASE63_09220 [Bosea sp. Root381]
MRALVVAALAAVSATSADALELIGQAGVLGEWELTGNLAATGARQEFGGPIVLKHTGICSADGPETRAGEIRLQLLGTSRVRATLTIDGTACTFRGRKSDAYVGMMSCYDRRDAPLRFWIK